MAPRAFWKGYLKLSLVTCAVTMNPATSERDRIRFHTLNAKTGNRVASRYVDAVTGKPVKEGDEVKGYPRGEDDFVMLEDKELDAVALESTRTIDIETFVPADDIGWIWYDKPHYLHPADKVGRQAFAVIRAAMEETGTVGIARLVLYRREQAVMLVPAGEGIVVWTLRYGDEVREAEAYFSDIPEDKAPPAMVKMIGQLIRARRVDWSPEMVRDPVQENLAALIRARQPPRKKRPAKKAAPLQGNVVNIMEALKQSLAAEKKSR